MRYFSVFDDRDFFATNQVLRHLPSKSIKSPAALTSRRRHESAKLDGEGERNLQRNSVALGV